MSGQDLKAILRRIESSAMEDADVLGQIDVASIVRDLIASRDHAVELEVERDIARGYAGEHVMKRTELDAENETLRDRVAELEARESVLFGRKDGIEPCEVCGITPEVVALRVSEAREWGSKSDRDRVAALEDDKRTLLRAANGDLIELQCLKDAGVDNWGGWEQAQDALEEFLVAAKPDLRGEGKSDGR